MSYGVEVRMSKRNDKTSMGGTNESFQTTCWTDIRNISTRNDTIRQRIAENLIRRYWKPVYCYLRVKRHSNENAKDLTQGFFTELVLGSDLVEHADQTKGRFRAFLLTALSCYVISVHRKKTAQRRSPAKAILSLDDDALSETEMVQLEMEPDQMFDYAWASYLIDRVLNKVRENCYTSGKEVYWEVFNLRVLSPIIENTKAMPLPEIRDKYGLKSEQKVSNMIATVKRMFKSNLDQQLKLSVKSGLEIQNEFDQLLSALSMCRTK